MPDLDLAPYELSWEEKLFIIIPYWEENNLEPMAKLILTNAKMTDGMRRFVSDVYDGTIKRPKGKRPSHYYRDMRIFDEYSELTARDGRDMPLLKSKLALQLRKKGLSDYQIISEMEGYGWLTNGEAVSFLAEKHGLKEGGMTEIYKKGNRIKKLVDS